MGYNPENLERGNKSETSRPTRPVSKATISALGATAIKGSSK